MNAGPATSLVPRSPAADWLASRWLAPALALAHLLLSLGLLADYGPTWDTVLGDFAYGERILDSWLHGTPLSLDPTMPTALSHRAPHPEFQFMFDWSQLFPFAATWSAASCHLLHDELGWMAPLSAHHLVIVLGCSLLVFVLVRFAQAHLGGGAALAAIAFLFASPTFFAHSFNNLKDVPETCLYAFAALAGFRAARHGGVGAFAAFGALVGCALAQKPNVLFLPPQLLAFAAVAWPMGALRPRWAWATGTAVSLGTFAGVYLACSPAFWTDGWTRFGQHVAAIREVGNTLLATSVSGVPAGGGVSWHGVHAVLTTLPLPLLALALVGCCAPGISALVRTFLLLWLLTPIGRTLLPGMRTFDGVRHFLEFHPAMALLAAHGLAWGCRRLRNALQRTALVAAALVPGALAVWQTHPNGICWRNALGGSLAAQQAAGHPDATDFWGNSYWQAIDWLNAHAEPDARVLAAVNPAILACGASVKLRPDLVVWDGIGPPPADRTVYVAYVTRRDCYGKMVKSLEARPETCVHTIEVQGGPILRLHALRGEASSRAFDLWNREHRAAAATRKIMAWLGENATNAADVARLLELLQARHFDAVEQLLTTLLPPEFAGDIGDAMFGFR